MLFPNFMRIVHFLALCLLGALPVSAMPIVSETIYVEAPIDSDQDGRLDKIYVTVNRPEGGKSLPTIYEISPYALGGNNVPFHNVDVDRLPQDEPLHGKRNKVTSLNYLTNKAVPNIESVAIARGYASVKAHSLGTGYSEGCPTVGDEAETLAAKAVIDWLNGRATASYKDGKAAVADWANGSVGMTGVSYVGTLPNMVASTGVEGLKAIIPVAAISSWYDYYRANGLVVGPGGYIGEDADILGMFIVRKGACKAAIQKLTEAMGREHGDFTEFWQARDYVRLAGNVRAAVFIMHGQSDWNVRQRHAIEWWEALGDSVPRRMWLHKGGHSHPSRSDTQDQMFAWFDRYVKGEMNQVESEPAIEVQLPNGRWSSQAQWPNELTHEKVFYLNSDHELSENTGASERIVFVDVGKDKRLQTMFANPTQDHANRLAFVSEPLSGESLLSGTPRVQLAVSVLNRKAANMTVAIVDYDQSGSGRLVTQGWVDPQNHHSLEQGELLTPGQEYTFAFELEPKQYSFARGHRIGVVVTATDYEHTLRPDAGTQVAVEVGEKSWVELHLSLGE